MHGNGRFADLTNEELREELSAQRELMRDWKKMARRNPYYNPQPGLNRLQDLQDEIERRRDNDSSLNV